MEIWDGLKKDGSLAGADLVRGEIIPDGLYHLVCDILVRHTDGDYLLMQRDFSKEIYGGYYEATAGGSVLKGEDSLTCAKRELYEETGIDEGLFEELDRCICEHDKSIYHTYLCVTSHDKSKITLQKGETIAYKWVSEQEFISFINSQEAIEPKIRRYKSYFEKMGYLRKL